MVKPIKLRVASPDDPIYRGGATIVVGQPKRKPRLAVSAEEADPTQGGLEKTPDLPDGGEKANTPRPKTGETAAEG